MYFLYNDDGLMNRILSGRYLGEPNGQALFVNYPVSGLLSTLYKIINTVPWYSIFLFACLLIPLIILIHKVAKKETSFITIVCICIPSLIPILFELSFTTVSGMLCIYAILWYLLDDNSYIAPAVLLALSYCIRTEMVIAGLAFFVVAVLERAIKNDLKRSIKALSLSTILILGCFLCTKLMYQGSDWDEYYDMNRSRVDLYDYTGFIIYDEAPELYEKYGISYEDYLLVYNYDLGLENADWNEILYSFSQIRQEYFDINPTSPEFVNGPTKDLRLGINRMKHSFKELILPYGLGIYAGYIALLFSICYFKDWIMLIPFFSLIFLRNALWLYLHLKGRFPERVYVPLICMELTLLSVWILKYLMKTKKKKALISVFCVALIVTGLDESINIANQVIEHNQVENDHEILYSYFKEHNDNTYLLDVSSLRNHSGRVFDCDASPDNSILLGGWITWSPIFKERMVQVFRKKPDEFIGDGGLALAERDDVFFVISKEIGTEWIEYYMKERFDGINMNIVSEISCENITFLICEFK